MRGKIGMVAAGGVALLAALAALPAHAEMEVTASNVSQLKVGAKLPDDARLKLPTNAIIRLSVRNEQGRSTMTLNGPFEGTVAEYQTKKPGWWDRLFSHGNDDPSVGATRGTARQPAPK